MSLLGFEKAQRQKLMYNVAQTLIAMAGAMPDAFRGRPLQTVAEGLQRWSRVAVAVFDPSAPRRPAPLSW